MWPGVEVWSEDVYTSQGVPSSASATSGWRDKEGGALPESLWREHSPLQHSQLGGALAFRRGETHFCYLLSLDLRHFVISSRKTKLQAQTDSL